MFTNKQRITICVSFLHISTISRQLTQTTEGSLDIHSGEPSAGCHVSQPLRACVRKAEYEDLKGGVSQRAGGNHHLCVRRQELTVKTKEKKDPILTSCMSTYMPTARLEDQTVFSSLCVPLLPMCGEAHHFFPALAPGIQQFLWLSYKHPFPSPSGHAIAYVCAIHIPHLIQKGIVGRPAYVA